MHYKRLGKTGLMVSEIGFGAEWIGKMDDAEVIAMTDRCVDQGINLVDCWMSDPAVRDALGAALEPSREKWIIQGHIGSTWQDNQYTRTRDMDKVRPAFEDLLARLRTDHIELGMIHYVDEVSEFNEIMNGEFFAYVESLLDAGTIGHIGISTHNPEVALIAAKHEAIEMIMFSINPAFDMLPASSDINTLFAEKYDDNLQGIDPMRGELYALCERNDVGLTVMKGYAGGRLLDDKKSPFGVRLTPVQCIHYALTRPAVASILVGIESVAQLDDALAYETATESERDYASVLADAPKHAYYGQCTYCGHCAPCVAGINIALVNKFADLAAMQDEVPASVRAHYFEMDATAEDCTGCSDCESRCPFGVPIAERMKEAAELFS